MTSGSFRLDTRIFKNEYSLILDGRTMFTFALGEAFKLDKGMLTVTGESKLHRRDGLVGMSGAYFHKKYSNKPKEI